eukprot:scaffold76608_cov56-Phaeocystis_antarctica.AAC.1
MAHAANLPDADDPRRRDDDIDGHVVLRQLPVSWPVVHHLAAVHGPQPRRNALVMRITGDALYNAFLGGMHR